MKREKKAKFKLIRMIFFLAERETDRLIWNNFDAWFAFAINVQQSAIVIEQLATPTTMLGEMCEFFSLIFFFYFCRIILDVDYVWRLNLMSVRKTQMTNMLMSNRLTENQLWKKGNYLAHSFCVDVLISACVWCSKNYNQF